MLADALQPLPSKAVTFRKKVKPVGAHPAHKPTIRGAGIHPAGPNAHKRHGNPTPPFANHAPADYKSALRPRFMGPIREDFLSYTRGPTPAIRRP